MCVGVGGTRNRSVPDRQQHHRPDGPFHQGLDAEAMHEPGGLDRATAGGLRTSAARHRAGPAFQLFPLLAGGDQGFGGVGVGGGEDLRLFLLRLLGFLVATRLVALGHFNDFFCVPEAGPAGWLGAVAAGGAEGPGRYAGLSVPCCSYAHSAR